MDLNEAYNSKYTYSNITAAFQGKKVKLNKI